MKTLNIDFECTDDEYEKLVLDLSLTGKIESRDTLILTGVRRIGVVSRENEKIILISVPFIKQTPQINREYKEQFQLLVRTYSGLRRKPERFSSIEEARQYHTEHPDDKVEGIVAVDDFLGLCSLVAFL